MKINYVLFEDGKSYYAPDGTEWTSEFLKQRYPRIMQEEHYFEMIGTTVLNEPYPVAYMLALYDLDTSLSGVQALNAIQAFVENKKKIEAQQQQEYVDPTERLAAAIEAQNLINGFKVPDAMIAKNISRGLWDVTIVNQAKTNNIISDENITAIEKELSKSGVVLKKS